MIKKYLDYLCDPINSESLKVEIFKEVDGELIDGLLSNKDNWYPVIGGIPRMLTGKLKKELLCRKISFLKKYHNKLSKNIESDWNGAIEEFGVTNHFDWHQQKTADSFAYEWKNIYKENDYEKNNFYHFLSPFVKESQLLGKKTIDIGCGSGRFTKWAALAKTEVSFGTDLGESVEVAYELVKDLKNVCIVQADIYQMPFKEKFDLAYSIGVIHHLPQPKNGFLSLIKMLKSKGMMLIWVYNRRNNLRAIYIYETLRTLTRKIPKVILMKLCYIPAIMVHLLNMVTKIFKIKKAPFKYYENFPFNMKLNDAFDVLATPKSNYYKVEEIKKWYKEAGLKNIKAYEHLEAGITCIGLK